MEFLDKNDQSRQVLTNRKKMEISTLVDLPNHAILDRGRLIGLWEFEASTGKIIWNSFVTADKELKAVIAETEKFVSEDLRDARSFSLDSPESRAPRIAALRA